MKIEEIKKIYGDDHEEDDETKPSKSEKGNELRIENTAVNSNNEYDKILHELIGIGNLNKFRTFRIQILVLILFIVMVFSSNMVRVNLVIRDIDHSGNTFKFTIGNDGLRTAHDVVVIVRIYKLGSSETPRKMDTETKDQIKPFGTMSYRLGISELPDETYYYRIEIFWHNDHRTYGGSLEL